MHKKSIWNKIEQFLWENQLAIFSAIAFHFILAIIFMGVRIKALQTNEVQGILIEFPEEIMQEETPAETPDGFEESNYQQPTDIHNVAVNRASEAEKIFDIDKYIEDVQEQLDETNPKENLNEDLSEAEAAYQKALEEKNRKREKKDVQYAGRATVNYEMYGRDHTYIPLPVYKCEGAGTVAVSIFVNREGYVTEATVIASESTTTYQCFLDMAIDAAKRSKFQASANSPESQKGKIIYTFFAQ